MRKQTKNINSLAKDIEYKKKRDNSNLREILFREQKGFCAYTETYLGRTDEKNIDHFNPSQDYNERNKYSNLFLCKSQWNKEKSNKWAKFQSVLSPLNDDFENRVSYNKELKIFEAKNEKDNEAKHLIELLKLDNYDLSLERKKHIELYKELIQHFESPEAFFKKVIQINLPTLSFIRSLEEEFEINIWDMIPEPK
ncbi:hypothetical protein K5L04_11700 [Flavobacterium psychrophilum]|uniref:hypothetical protein n=1 Tax=Flavobacterium psychrophilum TaxID=96345 RepID=UPI000B7C110E|nr:hypothetical protein [Flavobacterium psychrophilum]EKT4549380.1 hypothetical protein [Flavobacterium psychrophilum]MCB6061316.1 hypothetical protein [Flavobacterium psychrophilum]QZL00336.1 hypothetical protein K5L04_11700 [Flavobacterium psychrophilum]SNB44030.1 conserved hypothetical protein [Flavobacterium psychrophilum]